VPVVVVKDGEDPERPRDAVVVGLDASERSQWCLACAFDQAASRGTGLDVVHACSSRVTATYRMDQAGHLVLAEALAGWTREYPDVQVTRSVVHDDPVSALVRHADGAYLLVVGSRGRDDVSGLILGSVSREVLRRAFGPVAVIRASPRLEPKAPRMAWA
jgi:nucleotide-binding universal stress UspA family protein